MLISLTAEELQYIRENAMAHEQFLTQYRELEVEFQGEEQAAREEALVRSLVDKLTEADKRRIRAENRPVSTREDEACI